MAFPSDLALSLDSSQTAKPTTLNQARNRTISQIETSSYLDLFHAKHLVQAYMFLSALHSCAKLTAFFALRKNIL